MTSLDDFRAIFDQLPEGALTRSLDQAPVPAYVWERVGGPAGDFVFRAYNQAAVTMSHGRIAGFVGKRAQDMYGPESSVLADMRQCMATGTFTRPDVDHELYTTGERRRLTFTYVQLSADALVIYTEDFTLRLRLERQLRQAQKMDALGQLAAGVAHDFNNMVAAIEACCAVLAEALGPGSPHLREVDEVRLAGARAASLTRELLALRKKDVPVRPTVDLGDIAAGVAPMLRSLMPEKIRLDVRGSRALHPVAADPTQMEQLIMNLTLNARDAMPSGGQLSITAEDLTLTKEDAAQLGLAEGGDFVELAVADTGLGMDEATRERAFEPFFTTKGPAEGTGLGLSTVYGIVQQSGGHVSIDSEVGRGTTVRILLPKAQPRSTVAGAAPSSMPTRRGRILLVEDTAAVRRACRRTLTSLGFDVLEAASDADALRVEAAVQGELDLLLSDVNVPSRGGRALYEQLLGRRPTLRVLYISGHTREESLRHRAITPDAAFLQKPFAFSDLVAAVRQVMGSAADGVAATP